MVAPEKFNQANIDKESWEKFDVKSRYEITVKWFSETTEHCDQIQTLVTLRFCIVTA